MTTVLTQAFLFSTAAKVNQKNWLWLQEPLSVFTKSDSEVPYSSYLWLNSPPLYHRVVTIQWKSIKPRTWKKIDQCPFLFDVSYRMFRSSPVHLMPSAALDRLINFFESTQLSTTRTQLCWFLKKYPRLAVYRNFLFSWRLLALDKVNFEFGNLYCRQNILGNSGVTTLSFGLTRSQRSESGWRDIYTYPLVSTEDADKTNR